MLVFAVLASFFAYGMQEYRLIVVFGGLYYLSLPVFGGLTLWNQEYQMGPVRRAYGSIPQIAELELLIGRKLTDNEISVKSMSLCHLEKRKHADKRYGFFIILLLGCPTIGADLAFWFSEIMSMSYYSHVFLVLWQFLIGAIVWLIVFYIQGMRNKRIMNLEWGTLAEVYDGTDI